MSNVIQCPRQTLAEGGFPSRGRWAADILPEPLPITLELGCGRGEYTVALARIHPRRAFVGIDIKGARMYAGAREALDTGLRNALFLRTQVELLDAFFAPGEVEEIWITFPDPQMKKVNKRLTSARFLESYRRILGPGGVVSLKTDSPFLFEFTRRIVSLNNLRVIEITDDLYGSGNADPEKSVKTAYERQWLARGKKIKLLRFAFAQSEAPLLNPAEDDIEKDDYRAIPRASSGVLDALALKNN